MSNLISKIINRHSGTNDYVAPRRRSIFERSPGSAESALPVGSPFQVFDFLSVSQQPVAQNKPNNKEPIETTFSLMNKREPKEEKNILNTLKPPLPDVEKGKTELSPRSFSQKKAKLQLEKENVENTLSSTKERPFVRPVKEHTVLNPKEKATFINDLEEKKQGILLDRPVHPNEGGAIPTPSYIASLQQNKPFANINQIPNRADLDNHTSIKIHIGRIEIKAAQEDIQATTPEKAHQQRAPKISLDQFLKSRK
jgi:hypothetical protein